MRIHLLAVGTRMPKWVSEAYEEYAKRLPRECQLILKEIEPARRNKNDSPELYKSVEARRILAAIPKNSSVVALDVKGKSWSTEELSVQMTGWMQSGQDVALIIGGPDGLDEQCLSLAKVRWSISPLTLPHPIVRVVLAEQLYRAWSITQNHPYHRA